MKNFNIVEYKKYLDSNFKNIYAGFDKISFPNEIDGFCESCKKDVFLKVSTKLHSNNSKYFPEISGADFYTLFVRCPRCQRNSFLQYATLEISFWCDPNGNKMPIDYNIDEAEPENEEQYISKINYYIYEILNLPTQITNYSLEYIPSEYKTLIETTSEAIYCMQHHKNISAAIMFRRALQIIVKDILGGRGRTLYDQLKWLQENENNLNVDLNEMFHDNSNLIKNIGNQGAHPDNDEELQSFTEQDIAQLHDLYLIIVTEIFIKPEKLRKLKEELKINRKLS